MAICYGKPSKLIQQSYQSCRWDTSGGLSTTIYPFFLTIITPILFNIRQRCAQGRWPIPWEKKLSICQANQIIFISLCQKWVGVAILTLFWLLKCKGKSVGELVRSISSLLKIPEALALSCLPLDIIVREHTVWCCCSPLLAMRERPNVLPRSWPRYHWAVKPTTSAVLVMWEKWTPVFGWVFYLQLKII